MKTIIALTLGGDEIPSANFRLRQFYPYLEKESFIIKEINTKDIFNPRFNIFGLNAFINIFKLKKYIVNYRLKRFEKQLKSADIIWVNKIIDEKLLNIVEKETKKIVIDIDDAIWINGEELLQRNLNIADTVVVGNDYLEENIRRFYSGKIKVIPTSIDLAFYPLSKVEKNTEKFRIGWLGSFFTNDYLLDIKEPINKFLKETNSEFHIISSNFDKLKTHFDYNTIFEEWDKNTYIEKISKFDVGIMPLPDTEWSKGKCSFKMLQYMGAHIPVISSPFGMNKDILDKINRGGGRSNK